MKPLNLYLLVFPLLLSSNVLAQSDITVDVFVHDNHTEAPLESALVKILHEGEVLDSSYTGSDGWARLTITPVGVEEMQPGIPNTFTMSENYPNPFRDDTRVDFSLPESRTVRAGVYNILGQRVLSEDLPLLAGYYTMNLSLSHLPTGIYFLRLQGNEQQAVKLMKIGGDVLYESVFPRRGSIQVTARSGVGLPLQKTTGENEEYTIRVEKYGYESWFVTKRIEFDMEITVPMVMIETTTVTDIDGNEYQTVMIGNQWWMAENLKVSRYLNGDAIPTNLSNSEWKNTTSGAFTIYPHGNVDGINSNEEMVAAYGKLYNWYAVDDDRGLCPEGWRVPSDNNWKQLEMYLGMSQEDANNIGWRGASVGGKLKSTRTESDPHPRWSSPNEGATNESGFSGLPGGRRDFSSGFSAIGNTGYWWSSTERSLSLVWFRFLGYDGSSVFRYDFYKYFGYSVRCFRGKGLSLTSPTGGEIWHIGSNQDITWTSIDIDYVNIHYSINNGSTWNTIATSVHSSQGSYEWTVPDTPTDEAKVRVCDVDDSDICDESRVFRIDIYETGTVTDIDDNVYQTVKIGDQWWMAENLRVSRYRDGSVIPTGLSNDEWSNTTTGAYAIYPHSLVDGINSEEEMVNAYGKLYNWYAVVDNRDLCPEGWRVPSDDNWIQLEMYLGMSEVHAYDWVGSRGAPVGDRLKSTRTEPDPHPRWTSLSSGATNESGFSGLPGGSRYNGSFYHIEDRGYWWSSTEASFAFVFSRGLRYDSSGVIRDLDLREYGRSVRCMRD